MRDGAKVLLSLVGLVIAVWLWQNASPLIGVFAGFLFIGGFGWYLLIGLAARVTPGVRLHAASTESFLPAWEAMLTRVRVGDPRDPAPAAYQEWLGENKRTAMSAEVFLERYRLRRPPFPWSIQAMQSAPGTVLPPVAVVPVVIPPWFIRDDTRANWGTHPRQELAADLFVSPAGMHFVCDAVGTIIPVPWSGIADLRSQIHATPEQAAVNAAMITIVDANQNDLPFVIAFEAAQTVLKYSREFRGS